MDLCANCSEGPRPVLFRYLCSIQRPGLWAQSEPPLRRERKSGLDWRTAHAVRQRGSNVDLLGDAQSVFQLNAKVAHSAVHFGVTKEQLNCAKIASLSVNFGRFRPAKRMGAIPARF